MKVRVNHFVILILHCGQSRSKSKLGVSTRVVLLCFGSRAFYVLHYRRWWLISYSIPIRLLAGFIAVRYRKLGREKNKYINYECNRYKWKTTNNMFISIKKIIYVALNICMSWTQKKYMHVFLPCSEYWNENNRVDKREP